MKDLINYQDYFLNVSLFHIVGTHLVQKQFNQVLSPISMKVLYSQHSMHRKYLKALFCLSEVIQVKAITLTFLSFYLVSY